jgi:hypothetical protein
MGKVVEESERKLQLIQNRFADMGDEELFDTVSQLEKRAQLDVSDMKKYNYGFKHFFPDAEEGTIPEFDMELLKEKNKACIQVFISLRHRLGELGLLDKSSIDINGNEMSNDLRLSQIMEEFNGAYETLYYYKQRQRRLDNPYEVAQIDANISRMSTMYMFEESRTSYQDLLLYLFDKLFTMRLKRYKGNCCRQILTEEGFKTRAYEPVMEIQEFVYSVTQKEDKFDMWCKMTSKSGSVKEAVKHLTDCVDLQFPELKKNRHTWSFNNGIFQSKVPTDDPNVWTCKFLPYGCEEYNELDPTTVSAKYFDKKFNPYSELDDWYHIPTPHMQKVIDYQGFNEEVSRWMYIFIGRLLYDVGELDCWQVIPFFKGIAGSGKSTLICKVVKKFYDADDVRVLSNNSEKKFGLWSIYDGFIFISPEIKGDICLEQAEFQSIVSGEDLSIARKNEKAICIQWKTPGILGGNEMPGWKDNSGSIIRRLVTFQFLRKVKDADPTLDIKLDEEIPAILCKCVRAYLDASAKYADVDIWNVIPDYFKTIQKQISMVTNPLHHFLGSEKCLFGKEMFVPQNIFVRSFNNHCIENNLGRYKFHPDFYAGPFGGRDIEVRMDTVTWNGKLYQNQPIIYGVDLSAEIIDE